MNVRMIFRDHISTWDTSEDDDTARGAKIGVSEGRLVLWSDGEVYDETLKRRKFERAVPRVLLNLGDSSPRTIVDFLDEAYGKLGLLRFDVDGETLWEAPAD